jgi:hypothetical protein
MLVIGMIFSYMSISDVSSQLCVGGCACGANGQYVQ